MGPLIYDSSSYMLAIFRGLSLFRLCAVILHVTDPWITGDKDAPSGYAVPWSLVNEHQILLEMRLVALSRFQKELRNIAYSNLHVVSVLAIFGSY